jgi:23S rRNA pseudouridine2457 synthase
MNFYSVIYKPFNVLCQFTSADGKATLKDYFAVPQDVYAVGRLDYDSEGLLVLTNDKQLNQLLLHPSGNTEKEYWVQVEHQISPAAIQQLVNGVSISLDGQAYATKAVAASVLHTPPIVPERHPPVRFRKNIPTSWLSITLTEGKNRQVRKMTAAVGFPTLRLIRYRIANCTITGMQPGDMREFDRKQLYALLNIAENLQPKQKMQPPLLKTNAKHKTWQRHPPKK